MAIPDNSASGGDFGDDCIPRTPGHKQYVDGTTNTFQFECSKPGKQADARESAPNRGQGLDGHDHFSGRDSENEDEHGLASGGNMHALRIEGRKWVNDITLPQAWAILQATAQELDSGRDLLFMMLMPNGRQPALCLDQSLFVQQFPTPAALAARLASRQEH